MTYLFFDTETTGFHSPKKHPDDPKQGRICQLAMILTDKNGRTLTEFSTLIAQKTSLMTEGAYNIHGISGEMCDTYGVKPRMALQTFRIIARKAKLIVAHNIDFDWKMIVGECNGEALEPPTSALFCTMKNTTNICKIPKSSDSAYKWPSLAEGLKFFCDKDIGEDAHDAMVDTRACKDIFFALKEKGYLEA